MAGDREEIARALYDAFAAGDREFFEEHLAKELTFSSPPDPDCFPGLRLHLSWKS